MKTRGKRLVPLICWLTTLALIAVLAAGLVSAKNRQRLEAADTLRDSIVRSAVCCYSIEGRYPQSLSYVEDNYGVYVDRDKFLVYYEIFADNIMPYVEVRAR